MKKYVIALFLVLAAILTVEVSLPVAAACIGTALVLTGGRYGTSRSA